MKYFKIISEIYIYICIYEPFPFILRKIYVIYRSIDILQ